MNLSSVFLSFAKKREQFIFRRKKELIFIQQIFKKGVLTKYGCGCIICVWLAYANFIFKRQLAVTNCQYVPNKVRLMNLTHAQEGTEYIIRQVQTEDEELNAFLFSLGCYSGEPITLVSRRKGSYVVSVKDGRYSIDPQLAEAIQI